jgi:hypothetical protein
MVVLLLAAFGVAYDFGRSDASAPLASDPAPSGAAARGPMPGPSVVKAGTGTFAFAGVSGQVVGRSGPVRTYRVAVEDGLGLDAETFGYVVEGVLKDPRSWTADGSVRLQRVGGRAASSFTLLLASPGTSERLCRVDGLETDQFTNCRLGDGRVVINSERWLTAVPNYGAALEIYQAYAVNHEVGHQLGHGHELCPAPGQPAPVMQQQTYGLQGCVANGWPFVNGARYSGPATNT